MTRLRFKDYLNEDVETVPLSVLIKQISIKNKDKSVDNVLSVSNTRGFIKQSEQFIDRSIASSDTRGYKIVRKGQFAYNPSRINVGSIALLETYREGIVSPIYVVFETFSSLIDIKFLLSFIDSYKFKQQMKSRLQGGVRVGLDFEALSNIEIMLPSLPEQQKIATLFSKLDERIELREQKILSLKEYKKGLQQAVFGNNGERTLRFKDGNGKEYPDWVQSKVGEIFEVSRGVVIAKTAISPNVNGSHKYPVYSSQTLNYGVMGYRDKFAYEGKRITWTTDGANAGTVSLRDGKFSCTNVCGVLSEKNSHIGFVNKCNAIIIGLLAPKFVSYVGNPKLMSNVMSEIVIKVPVSIEEQEKIANLFSKIDNQIELEEQLLQAAKDEKQGLMQRVF